MWKIILGFILVYYPAVLSGNTPEIYLLKQAPIDVTNFVSLQRGAKYFMNFCSGCHSLRFMRYNELAVDLKIIDKANSAADNRRLNNSLIFTQTGPSDTIKPSLHKRDALKWFGRYPPDLSLSTRARSIDWVYNYLLGFYQDDKRPFGVNNYLVKNTAMPDPLALLRENTFSDYQIKNNDKQVLKTGDNLDYSSLTGNREIFVLEEVAADLVNFLAYVAEPSKVTRQLLGIKVCAFLIVLSCLVYCLKEEIWRNKP
jgi:ubiquinol-cytochrome c reductase cytochrome c1 subunit